MKTPRAAFALLILSFAAPSIHCAHCHGHRGAGRPAGQILRRRGGVQIGFKQRQGRSPSRRAADHEAGRDGAGKKIDGYKILAGPLDIEAKPLAALRTAVLDPANYDWDIATACEFQPGVAIRFNARAADGKPTHVDLVFCFVCGELETWQDGKRLEIKFFGNHRAPFNAAMKMIFPHDAEIQKLTGRE